VAPLRHLLLYPQLERIELLVRLGFQSSEGTFGDQPHGVRRAEQCAIRQKRQVLVVMGPESNTSGADQVTPWSFDLRRQASTSGWP